MCVRGGTAEKGQRKHAMYCRRVGVWRARLHAGAQPGAAYGGGAERCYTGNEPHETCLLHTRPMRSPGVAWGVDPVTITNDH